MTIINEETRKFLKERFDKDFAADVEVVIFTDTNPATQERSEYVEFTAGIFKELSEISPRIIVKEEQLGGAKALSYGITTDPSVMIGENKGYRIIFNGAPAGHEFTSVIETLLFVSRGESGLSSDSQARIEAVPGTARVQIFVTAECPLCPQSVILSHRVAVASEGRITSECVETAENLKLSAEYNVSGVPQQVINSDKATVTVGVQPETVFVDQVLKNLK